MMVEAPAKRLRILQSVEVDETNRDYIEAKQKQQQNFKSRLERIFDKYESMHESMSDEIDFKTGKVVVDRGHIRRVQRQLTRKGPTLVDNFLGSAPEEDSGLEAYEEKAGSEDELAPTQPRKRKRNSAEASTENAQNSEYQGAALESTPRAVPTALEQSRALQIPNTPIAATTLLDAIHFPQTALGQQAQAAFVANLNQTIVQAVQQVVAPLFGMLQNTPNAQAPQVQFPVTPLHLPQMDAVRPAADPKWYFPPISAAKRLSEIEHPRSSPPVMNAALSSAIDNTEISSPLVTRRMSPRVKVQMRPSMPKRKRDARKSETNLERPCSPYSLPAIASNTSSGSASEPSGVSREVGKSRGSQKYHFTEDDDAYISESRTLHDMSFKDIQGSKAKWSGWPASAFSNRWNNHLKHKKTNLRITSEPHLSTTNCLPASVEQQEHFFSSIEIPETSSAEHRLPTPSSLEQRSNSIEQILIPSSSHFDDDELELLSLAGADVSDVQPRRTFDDDTNTYPAPDEPLPSIEGAEYRDEGELQDELQAEMLKAEDSPIPELPQPRILPSTIPETQESAFAVSPPSQKYKTVDKPRPKPIATYRARSNSSDDLDLIGASDEPSTPRVYIKRESLTPQATRILCSSPVLKTPKPLPQSSGMAKSTGKLNRRAFLNDVKKGWAKGYSKASSSQKRRSFNGFPKVVKRVQVDIEAGDSEDELAV